jgi:hypothetical protein
VHFGQFPSASAWHLCGLGGTYDISFPYPHFSEMYNILVDNALFEHIIIERKSAKCTNILVDNALFEHIIIERESAKCTNILVDREATYELLDHGHQYAEFHSYPRKYLQVIIWFLCI